jgi:hypothetical protein
VPKTIKDQKKTTPEALKQCNCFFKSECKEVLYYYHSDHVGSSTFLSDAYGKSYEFMLYLPYGEEMTDRCEAKS